MYVRFKTHFLSLIFLGWGIIMNGQDVVVSAGIFLPQEVKNESSFNSDPKMGYSIGIQTIYGADWNIITGIEYIINNLELQGEITDSLGMTVNATDDLKMHTFNVPLYISKSLRNEDIVLRPYAGFDISFILRMNDNAFGLVKDDLDKIQLWFTGGLALDLNSVVLNGRYSYGLGRYFKADENNLRFGYVSASIGLKL